MQANAFTSSFVGSKRTKIILHGDRGLFLSNLANRQTDKCRQMHLPPPLSAVKELKLSYMVTVGC